MHHTFSFIFKIITYLFALIGLSFVLVFLAMRFDLLNVTGSIDNRNQFFFDAYRHLTNPQATNSPAQDTTSPDIVLDSVCLDTTENTCIWNKTPEWAVIAAGLRKDESVIKQVAEETGIPPRVIAAGAVPEQLRFFSSNREVFKRWFEPMKILGSLSQFSLGVSGIKQETANRIEEYANDPQSQWYPGEKYANLLVYETDTNHDQALYNRLTDEHNHYYSYLYTAVFLAEIESQWQRAGFPIDNKPEILVTLFNLGFDKSQPHENPVAGGASLNVGNTNYTYGGIGGLFYYSDELTDIFPPQN